MGYLAEGSGSVNIINLPGALAALEAAGFEADDDGYDNEVRFYPWHYFPTTQWLEFHGEKLRDSALEALRAIAPFVAAGSYVEMMGEDNAMWRWVFDGVTVHELRPTITWPDVPEVKK